MSMWNPHDEIVHEVAEMLRNNPWFKSHSVEIVEQNKGSLAEAMKKGLGSLGVVCVVGVDKIRNFNTFCEADIFVSATEAIPTNRAHQDFVTALDVALASASVINGEWWKWIDTEHETPHDYVLQATSSFTGSFRKVETEDPTKTDHENKEE